MSIYGLSGDISSSDRPSTLIINIGIVCFYTSNYRQLSTDNCDTKFCGVISWDLSELATAGFHSNPQVELQDPTAIDVLVFLATLIVNFLNPTPITDVTNGTSDEVGEKFQRLYLGLVSVQIAIMYVLY